MPGPGRAVLAVGRGARPGRGAARSQGLNQRQSQTAGSQTAPDSVPKPSLSSSTAVISGGRQRVPGNTCKERSRGAEQLRSPGLGEQPVCSASPPCRVPPARTGEG